jgi:hypothetical protein
MDQGLLDPYSENEREAMRTALEEALENRSNE